MKLRAALLTLAVLSSCGAMSGPDGGSQSGGGSATGGGAATGGGSATGGGVEAGGGSATGGGVETGGGSATGGGSETGGGSATGGGAAVGGGSATGGSGGYVIYWDGGAALDAGTFETTYAYDWRGEYGQRIEGTCEPMPMGTVWGTDLYTDDSDVCVAAVHAGVFLESVGGVAVIEIRPGAASYVGSLRNGITSFDFAQYGGSFAFVGSDGGLLGNVNAPPEPDAGVEVDAGTPVDAGIEAFDWYTSADAWTSADGTRITGYCASGGTEASLWGTDVYTDDSSICTAAVHVGVITFDGGVVTFEIRPGEMTYVGSARNGVTSTSYGEWDRSFVIVP